MSNYIHQLEDALAVERAGIEAMAEWMMKLRQYLLSDKFRTDTTVQVQDIHNWLDRIQAEYGQAVHQSRETLREIRKEAKRLDK